MGFKLPDTIILDETKASVPVNIIRERRQSLRAAVGATGLIFRIPDTFNLKQFEEAWLWFSKWVNQLVIQKPSLLNHLIPKQYASGDLIVMYSEPLEVPSTRLIPLPVVVVSLVQYL